MRIGMFMPTMNQNWVFSNTSPVSMPEWFLAEQAALKAEHYNFDFLLSAVKFRGLTATPARGTTLSTHSQ
ncbi:hypothetical protein ACFQV8_40405 [Pseudonocardia benzenivorans]